MESYIDALMFFFLQEKFENKLVVLWFEHDSTLTKYTYAYHIV